ncbi:MAG TPA: hypothetical protein RMG48_18770 [Myxococcales bacterium LLY-WYZ-16_1]|nr:hypothetical protein [Myxococcales bacterium LLY-WYZ-16_1]
MASSPRTDWSVVWVEGRAGPANWPVWTLGVGLGLVGAAAFGTAAEAVSFWERTLLSLLFRAP